MTETRTRAEWLGRIPCLTPTQTPKAILANALFALEQAPEWSGVLAFDEFSGVILAVDPPPWCSGQNTKWKPRLWTDTDDARTTEWLHHQGICVSQQVAASAVLTVAQTASFHPLKDYLEGLKWDGKKRLDSFASAYLGADDTPYHAATGTILCLSAVARVFRPGCKADTMTILEGGQGTFKSSALEAMFHPWFSDDIADLGSKDAAMQARAAWCIEVAELASMAKSEVEKVKAFVSRRVDRYRPSYGRNVVEQLRTCIFAGTTNSSVYLRDETALGGISPSSAARSISRRSSAIATRYGPKPCSDTAMASRGGWLIPTSSRRREKSKPLATSQTSGVRS